MLLCVLMLQEIWYLEYKMKKEIIGVCMFLLIGIMTFGFVSAADYKFQNKSGTDLVIIHGDTGNLTVAGNLSASTGLFQYLGSLLNRISKLFVQDIDILGNINLTGDLNVSKTIYLRGVNISTWETNVSFGDIL